jgi:hypothetical protein
MFLPNEYLVHENGKELQREADHAALVRLVREDSPAPITRWLNRMMESLRRPQIELPQQTTKPAPNATRQTAALRRVS